MPAANLCAAGAVYGSAMSIRTLTILAVIAGAATGLFVYACVGRESPLIPIPRPPPSPPIPYEEWARQEFYRRHPGEKPLNWEIGAKAEEFYGSKPMGPFVLHENDCSDFVDALIDDALGAKARFRRDSTEHLLAWRKSLWDWFYWNRKDPLLPGDELSVAHSPHYDPYEGSIRHCGIVGTDGKVYDWTKLKRWRSHRYGRHPVEWFTRHSPGPKGVIVRRLSPQYRYLIEPVPVSGRQGLARRHMSSR